MLNWLADKDSRIQVEGQHSKNQFHTPVCRGRLVLRKLKLSSMGARIKNFVSFIET